MTKKPDGNLATQIRVTLEDEISSGHLPPGAALDERALAERFGVSRTPVREALQQLAAIDLVHIASRNGVFVKRMTVAQLRSIWELLAELEAICAKLAARRIDEGQRAALEAALEMGRKAIAAGDSQAYRSANHAFHEAVYAASRNEQLVDSLRTIRRATQRYRINDLRTQTQIHRSQDDHERIAGAIVAGDSEAARDAMFAHVPIGTSGFSEFLSTVPSGFFEFEGE